MNETKDETTTRSVAPERPPRQRSGDDLRRSHAGAIFWRARPRRSAPDRRTWAAIHWIFDTAGLVDDGVHAVKMPALLTMTSSRSKPDTAELTRFSTAV